MSSSSKLVICAALGMLFLSGCVGFGKQFETPRISLVSVKFQQEQLETICHVELRILNTNEIPITIKGLECKLEVNGKDLVRGVSDTKTEVPAFGTVKVPVRLYSSVINILRGVLYGSIRDKFAYKVTGRLHLESEAMMPSVIPFSYDGELDKDSVK